MKSANELNQHSQVQEQVSGGSFSGLGNLFKLAFEQSQHLQCLVSLDGRVLIANQQARDLALVYHQEKVSGQHVWNLPWWRTEQSVMINSQFKQASKGFTSHKELELRSQSDLSQLYTFKFSPIKNILNTVTAVLVEGSTLVVNKTDNNTNSVVSDELTGLANSNQLNDFLSQVVHKSKNDPSHFFALINLKIDSFSRIKKMFGKAVSDEFLIDVARKLRSNSRDNDLVARIEEDTFSVLLNNLQVTRNALDFAKRCLDSLHSDCSIGNTNLTIDVHIGIAFGDGGSSDSELLKQSQEALEQALSSNTETVVFGVSQFEQGAI
jgi:diguanylate cyclase (GGDEF)-like protein